MKQKFRTYSFKDVLANLCRDGESTVRDHIKYIKESNVKGDLLNSQEVEVLDAFEKLCKDLGSVPTINLFNNTYPRYKLELTSSTDSLNDLIKLFIKQRKNELSAKILASLADEVRSDGVTPIISDKINDLLKLAVVDTKYQNVADRIVDVYESQIDNSGIRCGIAPVDEVVGGLKAGQVSVVAGFTGMGKSICSVSIMHSAIEQGYNVCYISLELSAEHLMYNLISRHSLDNKFSKKIEHRKLKAKTLSRTEWDYVKSDILPDLEKMPGKFYILDEQDLEGYNYFAFDNKLQEIENLCFKETGKGLDLIIVDHIQMLAFSNEDSKSSENTIINGWCNYFRKQCMDFLKTKRSIHVILVSQINRQGYLKAIKNNGMYNLTALKEANEIETCASVILGIFSDTALIASKQAKVGVLKNRDGSRVGDAYIVPSNYSYQLIGEKSIMDSSVLENSTQLFNNTLDDFSSFENDFLVNGLGVTFVPPTNDDSAFEESEEYKECKHEDA